MLLVHTQAIQWSRLNMMRGVSCGGIIIPVPPRSAMVELPQGRTWDMVVFDVDGTLMDAGGFHPDLIPLIREVEARGLPISLASGRTLPNVTPIRQSLGASGFIVAENGGMVWDSGEGHEIITLADGSRARAAVQWLATQIDDFDAAGIESNRWRETEWCLFENGNEDLMRELLAGSEWSDLIVVPTGFAVHITAPGIDKAGGLRMAFEQRGVDPGRVLVCGDAPNDISMFELCGFSVAVNDEREDVVDAADCLTAARGIEGSLEFLKAVIAIL